MHSSLSSLFMRRSRLAVAMALFLVGSVFGCFKDPKLDVAQPRKCQTDKSCLAGQVCGSNGSCCASADGKTCRNPVSTGGAGSRNDGSSGDDAPGRETGTGAGGVTGLSEVGAGGGGDGGMLGAGGVLDGRGAGGAGGGGERDGGSDTPLGGAGGGGGGAGINGSGGVASSGGINGSGGAIVTGGTQASGGGVGSGGVGSGGTTVTCSSSQKPCNGTCISNAECCGGCSGNTPVCSNGTCVGNPNGTSCTAAGAAACASGICADSVCCDLTCTGQCEACNTASAKGTCSPTTTPRTACTTDGTVCGGACDGTPAHRQACNYPTAQCVAGKCESGTQTYPRVCDGAGHCGTPTPPSRSCAPYACGDATSCSTGCPIGQDTCGGSSCVALNTAAHCGTCSNVCTGTSRPVCAGGTTCVQCTGNSNCSGSTPVCNTSTNTCVGCVGNSDCPAAKSVCSGGTCVQCTGDGNCSSPNPRCYNNACVQCTLTSDCTPSFGAGSTCNSSSHACQCRQPSSGNLLTNPGFETSFSGWSPNDFCGTGCPLPLEIWEGGSDSDSCPNSGAVRMSYYGFAFGAIRQCVNTAAGAYRFGYRFKQASLDNGDAVMCTVSAYSGTGCLGDSALDSMNYSSGSASGTWANPSLSTTFVAPSGTGSIAVNCQSSSLNDVWLDQVYLNASGGSY
jgi:hypothetical protein